MTRIRSGLPLFVVIVVAACQGSVTPSPPAATTAPSGARSPGPSIAAGGSSVPATSEQFRTTYAPAPGKDGGTIVIGDWQEANQFHPYFVSQATDARVAATTWATLVVSAADGGYAPDLATEIPTTSNGGVMVPGAGGDAMTVTWTLRDGLTWSDDQALTCDDFRYAWEWVNDPDNVGVISSGFEDIKAFECTSATEMIWHFDRIYAGYLTLLTAPLPRHYMATIPIDDQMAGVGFRAADVAKLPVSGAFKFESVTPGSELRLVRNSNYTSWSTGKPAHLDRLIWKWYSDADALIAGFRSRAINLATNLHDTDLPKVANLGGQVSSVSSPTYELLRPNWSATNCSKNALIADRGPGCPMSDPAIRRAVASAIDRSAINRQLLGGTALIATTNISPAAWFFTDQVPLTFDPVQARSTLEAAGWLPGRDGIRQKDGLRAMLELCTTTDQVRQDTLALVAAWLRDVGIEAVPNAVEAELMFADASTVAADSPCAISHGNFDLAEQALSSSMDPLDTFFAYHSSQVSPNGANEASVSDPTIDAVLRTVQRSADLRLIKDAMAEFQKVYVEKTIEIPLYYRKNVNLVGPKIGNFVANSTRAGPTWNAVDWYVK